MPSTVTKSKTKKMFHRGRQFVIKENGLPEGSRLYWLNSERKYIYAKVHGKRFACGTDDWRVAVDRVEEEQAKHARRETGLATGDVLVKELLDDLIQYYEDLARKRGDYAPDTAYITGTQVNMKDGIREMFGDLRVSKIMPAMYADYRRKWEQIYLLRDGKPANTVQNTIDHHLTALKRAIKLGQENLKVGPNIPLPKLDKENSRSNTRSGIIDATRFDVLIPALPDWLRPVFATCHATGIRRKEATFIHRSEVDFTERLINLRAHETKSKKARTCPIPQRYWPLILDWEERTRREHPKAEFLFHREGEQLTVEEMEDAFNGACESLELHKPIVDEHGKPVLYRNRNQKFDRTAIKWHDTKRTATTTVSNLAGLTDTDIYRTVGLTSETHMRYDKTESAKKVRDAQDAKHAQVQPTETLGNDKRSKLAELKGLLDDGIIDAEEYKQARAGLLAS